MNATAVSEAAAREVAAIHDHGYSEGFSRALVAVLELDLSGSPEARDIIERRLRDRLALVTEMSV